MMDEEKKQLLVKKLSALSSVPKRSPDVEHLMEHSNGECSKQGISERGVWNTFGTLMEHEKCQNGTPPELEKWHPTPRYVLAELERSGLRREDMLPMVWEAWRRAGGAS
jgi:hypothetical protein